MKNYYELLEINKGADATEIKRAYFKLVRKYPPERFPEEFKELRNAYEILSDEKMRAEYDKINDLPPGAASLLETAKEYSRTGQHKQAIEILKSAVTKFPKIIAIKRELALAYEREGKSGLAIKLWEKLVKEEPDNADYIWELALSYSIRGWNKKSVIQFEKAVELDSGNAKLWNDYINLLSEYGNIDELRLLCNRAIKATEEKNTCDLSLYSYAIHYLDEDDEDDIVRYWIKQAKQVMLSRPAHEEDESFIIIMLNGVMSTKKFSLASLIHELADLLPRKSDKFDKLLTTSTIICDIDSIIDKGFDELIHDILATAINKCECDECKREMLVMEYTVLAEFNTYRSYINRLKKEYPHLYNLHANFFDEILLSRNHQKLLLQRIKAISKFAPNEFEEDSFYIPQTVRREGPKIGRNDPCPCGSGKKYKKCCGAGV